MPVVVAVDPDGHAPEESQDARDGVRGSHRGGFGFEVVHEVVVDLDRLEVGVLVGQVLTFGEHHRQVQVSAGAVEFLGVGVQVVDDRGGVVEASAMTRCMAGWACRSAGSS